MVDEGEVEKSWRQVFNAARPATRQSARVFVHRAGRRPGACPWPTRRVRDAVIVGNLAGASTAVTVLWKISGLIHPAWDKSYGAALVCALLISAVLCFISETDPRRGPMNSRDYVIEGDVALVQSKQGRSRAESAALADCVAVIIWKNWGTSLLEDAGLNEWRVLAEAAALCPIGERRMLVENRLALRPSNNESGLDHLKWFGQFNLHTLL